MPTQKQHRQQVRLIFAAVMAGPVALVVALLALLLALAGCGDPAASVPGPQVSADPLAACANANAADPAADIATLPECAGLAEDELLQVEQRYLADLLGEAQQP